jgi:hypothetical protein
MPIRPELRQFYGRKWRTVTRPRILARAGDKCEQCKKTNHARVETVSFKGAGGQPIMLWRDVGAGWWCWNNGKYSTAKSTDEFFGGPDWRGDIRTVRVVLTIAHLNHRAGDDRDENLKALCQWCHLNYDKLHHRETRATRKDRARPLIVKATEPYQVTVEDALKELEPQLAGLNAMKTAFKKTLGG